MNWTKTIVATLLGCCAANSQAQTTFTWRGATDDRWQTPSNWEPSTALPGPGDLAIIPQTPNQPEISDSRDVGWIRIEAGAVLTIKGDATTSAKLVIDRIGGLSLDSGGELVVDEFGELSLKPAAGLHGSKRHAIHGTISVLDATAGIVVADSEERIAVLGGGGRITSRAQNAKLALETDLRNELTIEGEITISSLEAGKIFENNGLVHSIDWDGNGENFSGTILLESLAGVRGTGEWRIAGLTDAFNGDPILGGRIHFAASAGDITALSGDFTVHSGVLDIDADVKTTGALNFHAGELTVSAGKTFKSN